jgi:hypothetical protein
MKLGRHPKMLPFSLALRPCAEVGSRHGRLVVN